MATVTKSIGTSSRDYSTITAWEADLDDTNIYTSGDDAVGECYNDSTFSTNNVIINGGSTVGLSSITLGVATGERHDGTAGTGAILEKDSLWNHLLTVSTTVKTLVTDLEISSTYVTANGVIRVGSYTYDHRFSKLLIYASAGATGAIGAGFWRVVVDNCIMYGAINSGIGANTYYTPCEFVNNTIYCPNPIGNPGDRTISKAIIKNNIAFSTNATNSINSTGATSHPDWQNNLVNVGPNYGSNQYTETSSANLFVSTVSGSEDLHLNSTSTAIGKGANLSSQAGLSAFNTHPEYVAGFSAIDINGSNRAAFTGTAWDIGAHQYALTASIGTSSRDYSTITAWEADLDNTAKYGNGSNAVGECYNDSTFAAAVIIDGGGTVGLNSVKLTVATGEHHDGTAGTGAKIVSQAYYQGVSGGNTLPVHVSLLEVDYNSFRVGAFSGNGGSGVNQYSRLLLHNGYLYNHLFYYDYSSMDIFNNIIFDFEGGSRGQSVIRTTSSAPSYIVNNTIHDIQNNGNGYYLRFANTICKNCIGTSIGSSAFAHSSSPITSNNLSSDATADDGVGTGHIINVDPVKQFISTTPGSEDLHLVMGSDALNVGADLGNTPEGVQYDIDGYDRTASITWDIGADEAHEIDGEFGYKGFLSYLNRTTLRAG
jgi:hypothetical protein